MNTARKKEQKNGLEWCLFLAVRPTKTRALLFEILSAATGPQSVPELLASFKKRGSNPNKTTLYRTVEQLVAEGVITKVQLSETRVSYEMTTDHHHHFVCQECEQVTKLSFCEEVMVSVTRALARQGKQVRVHTFEFFGVCELCRT